MALLLLRVGFAAALMVGSFGEISEWGINAVRLGGTGGSYGGIDPAEALIGDDLTDGAINIYGGDIFRVDFRGIINKPGFDFLVCEARFAPAVPASVYITINRTRILIPGYGTNKKFTDSGLDLFLKNSAEEVGYDIPFDLYGAPLDLNDWGIASNAVVDEIIITGYYGSDIMGIGVFHPVPEPAIMVLLGSGLLPVYLKRKKKRSL